MQKIREEMRKNQNDPYVQVIGEFLLNHLDRNPQDAEKISNPDKTITKSLDEMRKIAEKKKVRNCAVLTDQEAFAIVLQYYGISQTVQQPAANHKNKEIDFDISLDDLL